MRKRLTTQVIERAREILDARIAERVAHWESSNPAPNDDGLSLAETLRVCMVDSEWRVRFPAWAAIGNPVTKAAMLELSADATAAEVKARIRYQKWAAKRAAYCHALTSQRDMMLNLAALGGVHAEDLLRMVRP